MLEDQSEELWGNPNIREVLIAEFRRQVINPILGKGHRGAVICQSDDGADVEVHFSSRQPDWKRASVPQIVTIDAPEGEIKLGLEKSPSDHMVVYGRAYV